MAAHKPTAAFFPTAIPTPEELKEAADLQVFDETGLEMPFGALVRGQKTIVVFIRHFNCCVCQDYVSQLSGVRKDALEEAGVKLMIVGCGDCQVIKTYKRTTSFPYDAYADPTKSLYIALGMTRRTLARTPAGQEKKSYVKTTVVGYITRGIFGSLKTPQHLLRAGDISQLGGEFIFDKGFQVSFVSRMKHTADHVEVADLMKAACVAYP